MDLKAFTSAVAQISEEKGIPEDVILETIETAIAAAYKKDYGKKGQIIRAKLDKETGALKLWQVKLVVDENMIKSEEEVVEQEASQEEQRFVREEEEQLLEEGEKKVRFNPEKHIMADEAKEIKKKAKPGDELVFNLETKDDFGRIAAQTAKQVILQRIREAERDAIFKEFKDKEDQIVSAIVQRVEGMIVFFDIGKATGVMLLKDQVQGEHYRMGERLRVYVTEVQIGPKGPQIYVSRSHPKILSRLFELEVPEIASGAVVIKSIAREPGERSKVAVTATQEGIDPIGSMVGQRGTRVTAVINELGGEKIDIIEWNENMEKFAANSLSPAKVLDVSAEKNRMLVTVAEDQLSLAIGKEGQNVRLAAKLTGWKMDIKSREAEKVKESAKSEEKPKNKKEEKKEKKPKKLKETKKSKKTKEE
jgi:N utilization substance protein A